MVCRRMGEDWHTPGGAANVVACLSALGVDVRDLQTADLRYPSKGHAEGYREPVGGWDVSVKHRFVAGRQQLLRIDEDRMLPPAQARRLIEALSDVRNTLNAQGAEPVLLVSDYGKGALDPVLEAPHRWRDALLGWPAVVIDPAPKTYATLTAEPEYWSGAQQFTIIKVSLRELLAASRRFYPIAECNSDSARRQMAERLLFSGWGDHLIGSTTDAPSCVHLVATLGSAGVVCASSDGVWGSFPAVETHCVDPMGAGDAFSAALAYDLAQPLDHPEEYQQRISQGVEFAQLVAAVSVQSRGCGNPTMADIARHRAWLESRHAELAAPEGEPNGPTDDMG